MIPAKTTVFIILTAVIMMSLSTHCPAKTGKKKVLPFALLFNESDLKTIRSKAETPWGKKIMKHLRAECRQSLKSKMETEEGGFRSVSHQAMILSFVGLVDKSEKYHAESKKRVLEVCKVNPLRWKEMLNTGATVANLCLALDWGWQVYSKKEAVTVIEAMIASAIENGDPKAPINNYPDSLQNWGQSQSLVEFLTYEPKEPGRFDDPTGHIWHKEMYTTNNWDVVVGSGLMLGWAVVSKAVNDLNLPVGKTRKLGFELDQKKLDHWYGIAKDRYVNFVSRCYSARGQYNEGPGYYSYGSEHGLMGLEVARRIKGQDYYTAGLKKSPEWRWALYPWDVKHGSLNLNDSRLPAHVKPHVIARLAAENQSPWMQQFFMDLVKVCDRLTPFSLIWADANLKPAPLPVQLKYLDFGEMGDVVWRTGRDLKKDMHCVFRCGQWNGAHTHRDRNGIVLSAFGERLLVDAGTSDYSSDICNQYQRAARGHNVVLMGGMDQVGQTGRNDNPTWGRILHSEGDSLGNATVIGDAKHCYAMASTALRAVRFDQEGFIVVYDYCVSPEKSYSQLWHTDNRDAKASIKQTKGVFRIKRPNAELLLIPLFKSAGVKHHKGYIDKEPEGSAVFVELQQKKGVFLTLLVPIKKDEGKVVSHKITGTGKNATLTFSLRGKKHKIALNKKGPGFYIDDLLIDLAREVQGL
jgi:hypothetical protein